MNDQIRKLFSWAAAAQEVDQQRKSLTKQYDDLQDKIRDLRDKLAENGPMVARHPCGKVTVLYNDKFDGPTMAIVEVINL